MTLNSPVFNTMYSYVILNYLDNSQKLICNKLSIRHTENENGFDEN